MITSKDRSPEHCFGTPMPGQGRSRVCIRCGGREAVVAGQPCTGGRVEDLHAEITDHEYDPLDAA